MPRRQGGPPPIAPWPRTEIYPVKIQLTEKIQALALTAQERPRPATWLTGPSRTADLDKVLVLGAQGPGKLLVVLYEAEA